MPSIAQHSTQSSLRDWQRSWAYWAWTPASVIGSWTSSLTSTNLSKSVSMGNNTSTVIRLSRGAPQGCVLSPLMFTLLKHDYTAKISSNRVLKFTDDTTVLGLVSDDDESTERRCGKDYGDSSWVHYALVDLLLRWSAVRSGSAHRKWPHKFGL